MRVALLAGAGWHEIWPSIAALLLFGTILIPLSFLVFTWALRRTKVTGTLRHIWIFAGARVVSQKLRSNKAEVYRR